MPEIEFHWAAPSAFPAAAEWLRQNELPASDLDPDRVQLLMAISNGEVIGTAGLEAAGEFALLRSLAVAPEFRRTGVARALYEILLTEARRDGIQALYSLTTTADAALLRFGFVLVERDNVPASIRATAQFSSLCPASTRVYVQRL